ncbi:MAG: hypothetical protein QOG29_826 [Gaiellaceae bacterium]|nr:hypothetical protein [Gaiellaceae bacterium]MDX6478239.1 hypothetical protein [Gaiellaceae bacterium]MDX6489753.1 hypothetical protein [Gaiellaceae bacterium]MDX6493114.1 hypothetical protein [Gaiellaceae bacterium]MDX6518203.1 hypothetical protein [Gaiellaceae bacterium]
MADPVEKAKEALPDPVVHPVDTVKSLEAEAEAGRSERTPWIILGGVTATVGVVVAIVAAAILILYFVLGGK